MVKIVTSIIAVLLVLITGLSILGNHKEGDQTVTIRVISSRDNATLSHTESELRAIQVALIEINAEGGVMGGKKLILEESDRPCDLSGAREPFALQHIEIIIGGACENELNALAGVVTMLQAPKGPESGTPKIFLGTSSFISMVPEVSDAAHIAARYAYEVMKKRKAAVITESKNKEENIKQAFQDTFLELGGRVVEGGSYEGNASNTISVSLTSNKPDVIYIASETNEGAAAILESIRGVSLKNVKVIGIGPLFDIAKAEENLSLLEGVTSVGSKIDWENNQRAKIFKEEYQKEFGSDPGIFSPHAYDGVFLIHDALEETKSTDPKKIQEWIVSQTNWQGVLGKASIKENGAIGLNQTVWQVVSGEVKDLGQYEL